MGAGTNLLIVQAQNSGKAVVSGSDVFTGWKNNGSHYTHAWPHNWGVGPTGFFGIDFNIHVLERRRENIWINGVRMQQVLSLAELGPGKFHVVDNTDNNGRLTLVPPVGVDMATAKIEVAVRGAFPAGGQYNEGKLPFAVKDHGNFQIKGPVFQHSANYWNASPALSIEGGYFGVPYLSSGLTFTRCKFVDNNSVGFWTDYGGRDLPFDRCLFAGNQHGAIVSEMTYGPLKVRNSLLKNNRGAAIMAYNAQNIRIENSVLYGSYKGPMWGEDAALLCFHSDLRNDEGGKDTVEADEPDKFTGFQISSSTPIANRPDSEVFLEGKEATSRFAKQTFDPSVKSNHNRWFRRKGANDPGDNKAFFSTMLFNNTLDNNPDITFRPWQMRTGQEPDSTTADVSDTELDASPVRTKAVP